MLCALLFDSRDWDVASETLYHGLGFFIALGILELSGIYTMEWKKK